MTAGRPRKSAPAEAAPGTPEHRHSDPGGGYSINSLVVGLQVLEAVVRSEKERGISELAKDLGTTKWRIFRHLHTLNQVGYVTQNAETEKFGVGPKTYELVQAVPARLGFVRSARREMMRLRAARGHTVVIAAPIDLKVMILDGEVGNQAIQYTIKVGTTFHLHASAHGKVALAFGPPDLLERVLASGLTTVTEATITDPDALVREIDRVRRQGWAVAPEESVRGVNTLAVPIVTERGFHGSIAYFGSVASLGRDPDPADIEALFAAARRISTANWD